MIKFTNKHYNGIWTTLPSFDLTGEEALHKLIVLDLAYGGRVESSGPGYLVMVTSAPFSGTDYNTYEGDETEIAEMVRFIEVLGAVGRANSKTDIMSIKRTINSNEMKCKVALMVYFGVNPESFEQLFELKFDELIPLLQIAKSDGVSPVEAMEVLV